MYSIAILLVAIFSIQMGAGLAKNLFPVFGPIGTSFLRVAFASIMLLLYFKPWRAKWSKDDLLATIPYGVSLGVMNLTLYLALERIPLGVAVAIEFLGPLSVAIFSSTKKQDFLWALLAAAGIYLLMPFTSLDGRPLDPIGIVYALIAGLAWAVYIIFGQKSGNKGQGLASVSLAMTIAAFVILPAALTYSSQTLFQFNSYPFAIGVAFLSSALPYTLELSVLKKIPKNTFSILMSLEPAIAALSGLIFLNEFLSPIQCLAIGCIIIASIGCSFKK
jgi:inner membrane transporter RhtA